MIAKARGFPTTCDLADSVFGGPLGPYKNERPCRDCSDCGGPSDGPGGAGTAGSAAGTLLTEGGCVANSVTSVANVGLRGRWYGKLSDAEWSYGKWSRD